MLKHFSFVFIFFALYTISSIYIFNATMSIKLPVSPKANQMLLFFISARLNVNEIYIYFP
jgi:hypothetical protein